MKREKGEKTCDACWCQNHEMSRWRREVSGLIYASEGFTPRPPSHPLATKRVMLLRYSMHKGHGGCPSWPSSHSAIVSVVGPYLDGGFTDMVVCLFVCSSDGLDWAGTWAPPTLENQRQRIGQGGSLPSAAGSQRKQGVESISVGFAAAASKRNKACLVWLRVRACMCLLPLRVEN